MSLFTGRPFPREVWAFPHHVSSFLLAGHWFPCGWRKQWTRDSLSPPSFLQVSFFYPVCKPLDFAMSASLAMKPPYYRAQSSFFSPLPPSPRVPPLPQIVVLSEIEGNSLRVFPELPPSISFFIPFL